MSAAANLEATRAFLAALEAKDADRVAALFAEDGVHINPYHSGVFPTGANGREEIRAYWAAPFANFGRMTFPIDEIHAMGDAGVFVRFRGTVELPGGGGTYENDYYCTFKFNEAGEIVEYVEVFNPVTAARAFGLVNQLVAEGETD